MEQTGITYKKRATSGFCPMFFVDFFQKKGFSNDFLSFLRKLKVIFLKKEET